VHAFAEGYVKDKATPVSGDMQMHIAKWIDTLGKKILHTEVPFAWEPGEDHARELVRQGHRSYIDRSPTEFVGTVDLCWMDGETAVIVDYKTGQNLDNAPEQMRSLALMVARAWKVDHVRTIIVKVSETGCEEFTSEIDAFELELVAAERKEQIAAIPTSHPVPGMHCVKSYCNFRNNCPVTQVAMVEALPADITHKMSVEITSRAQASWLLPRVELLRDIAENMRDALKEYVRKNGPIPTSPGKEWGEGSAKDSTFNKQGALALLRDAGTSAELIDALTQSSSHPVFRERKCR
jgi:hypothetical protein